MCLRMRHTSPPPTTRTFLLRTCHAKISEPPPSTAGNSSPAMMSVFEKEKESVMDECNDDVCAWALLCDKAGESM